VNSHHIADARPGDGVTVQSVTELFQLAPDAPRIARCDLEELFLPDVFVGQDASIMVQRNGTTFDGTVKRISNVFGRAAPST